MAELPASPSALPPAGAPSTSGASAGNGLSSLNEALGVLQGELTRLRSAAEHIEESKQAAREAVEAALHVGQAASVLAGPTQTLVDRLDRVDFPARLDKIDATVSSLQVGFQTVQGRLDAVERNVKDDLQRTQAETARQVQRATAEMAGQVGQLERVVAERASDHAAAIKQLRLLLFVVLAMLAALAAFQLTA